MPIYEYSCRKCGNRFENLSRSANEPAPACPKCGSKETKRAVSSFSSCGGGCGSTAPSFDRAPRHFG